jgi:hypothetical protein
MVRFLTSAIIVTLFLCDFAMAENRLSQERAATYLRWNFFTGRDQLQFSKNGSTVSIKTLNEELFKAIKEEILALKIEDSYIKSVAFKESEAGTHAQAIEVTLKNDAVEMFSFYREREKKYVIDFWVDGDSVSLSKAAVKRPNEETPAEKKEIERKELELPKVIKKTKKVVKTVEQIDEEKVWRIE